MIYSRFRLLLTMALFVGSYAYGMEKKASPMNAEWFYDNEDDLYSLPNGYLQNKKWSEAEELYDAILSHIKPSEREKYNHHMAALNLASAQMAQRKPSEHWETFGKLCGIASERRLTKERLAELQAGADGTVVVRSNLVGIGDIAHFLPVIPMLKKAGVKDVRLAVRGFMHSPLRGPSEAYGMPLIDEKEADEVEGDHTHLLALYGLLRLSPSDLRCEKAIYTTTETALGKIRESMDRHADKKIAIVFLGEDRAATLIGGKQLPHDPKEHGRGLNARAFEQLLKEKPTLLLLDCNPEKSRISFDGEEHANLAMSSDYQERVIPLPAEDEPFDSVIALGLIWNKEEGKFVGFAGDNGPPNLFSHTLTKEAQRRLAFIIPNGDEYDMRMEGNGDSYTQMLSHCRVYRCTNPEEQADTIIEAFKTMTQSAESSAQSEVS